MSTESNVEISVITVTYNSAECIGTSLNALREQQGVRAEIIVIDNASSDNTVSVVRSLAGVKLLANRDNVGFGRGCNQGFEASRGRFLFMLNPDACLEQKDGLTRLCRTMEEHPTWGLAGTRILSGDGQSETGPAMNYPDQRHARCDFSNLPGEIAWVLGASLFLRREVFSAVGGFDPGFFLYGEETDLCLRIRKLGHEIGFVPEVTVRHIGGVSERGNDPYETRLRSMAGLHRFWMKHYPPDNVLHMIRRDRFRATLRREWYALVGRLGGPSSKAWIKHREYAAISEASRRFLKAHSAGLGARPESKACAETNVPGRT